MTFSVAQFVAMHGSKIDRAEINDTTATLELDPDIPVSEALIIFADLVGALQPQRTVMEGFHHLEVTF